jgi:hypothetical protein
MRLITLAALSAVSLVTFAAVQPAAAQSPQRRYQADRTYEASQASRTERITVIDENGRRTNRITVRPRSFLDPGTATRDAFQYHYADYAVPPNYSVFYDRNDWKGSWSRMPFNAPFDVPGSQWDVHGSQW